MLRWFMSLFYLPCDHGVGTKHACWRKPKWWSGGLQVRPPDNMQRTLYWCEAHRPRRAGKLDEYGDHLNMPEGP